MTHASIRDQATRGLMPSIAGRSLLVASELLTALVIIVGGGWLTALASLR